MRTILRCCFLAALFLFPATFSAFGQAATPLQQLYLLKEIKPGIDKIGVVIAEANPERASVIEQLQKASAATGIKVVVGVVTGMSDVAPKVRELTKTHGVKALWVVNSDQIVGSDVTQKYLVKSAAEDKMMLMAPSDDWVKKGACLSIQSQGSGVRIVVNKPIADALSVAVPVKYQDRTQYM